MDVALDLNETGSLCARQELGKGKVIVAVVSPRAIIGSSLTCFVPSLHEVVMYVGPRWSGDLHVGIVDAPTALMTGRDHGARVDIDPAYKNSLRWLARIDQPAFLMLAKGSMRPVPADAEPGLTVLQKILVGLHARKSRTDSDICGFGIGSPEDYADIEAARKGSVQHIEKGSAAIRHEEARPDECHGHPYTVRCRLDGFANAPECGLAINERADGIALP